MKESYCLYRSDIESVDMASVLYCVYTGGVTVYFDHTMTSCMHRSIHYDITSCAESRSFIQLLSVQVCLVSERVMDVEDGGAQHSNKSTAKQQGKCDNSYSSQG